MRKWNRNKQQQLNRSANQTERMCNVECDTNQRIIPLFGLQRDVFSVCVSLSPFSRCRFVFRTCPSVYYLV